MVSFQELLPELEAALRRLCGSQGMAKWHSKLRPNYSLADAAGCRLDRAFGIHPSA